MAGEEILEMCSDVGIVMFLLKMCMIDVGEWNRLQPCCTDLKWLKWGMVWLSGPLSQAAGLEPLCRGPRRRRQDEDRASSSLALLKCFLKKHLMRCVSCMGQRMICQQGRLGFAKFIHAECLEIVKDSQWSDCWWDFCSPCKTETWLCRPSKTWMPCRPSTHFFHASYDCHGFIYVHIGAMLASQVAQSKGGDAAARAEAKRSPDVWKKGGKPWMADAYRLAFGCFTRSLFWEQHLSRDWDHNVCKSDTAFQNPSKSHDCHGPKGNVTTKALRRISESFATLRCEDGEGWTPHAPFRLRDSASPPRWSCRQLEVEMTCNDMRQWPNPPRPSTMSGPKVWKLDDLRSFSQQVKRRWPMKRQNDAV